MSSEYFDKQKRDEDPVYLWIKSGERGATIVDLVNNSRLFVGSGPNCKIILAGGAVQLIHCLIWLDENRELRVQDWNTEGRTLVNGQPIVEITLLNSGDELQIGPHLIVPVLTRDTHLQINEGLPPRADTPVLDREREKCQPKPLAAPTDWTALLAEPDDFDKDSLEMDFSGSEFAVTKSEELVLGDCAGGDEEEWSENYEIEPQESFEFGSSKEEIEMLLNEVEQLRYELADRDSQLRMLTDREPNHESDDEDDEQTVRLVNRLEELLLELRTTDDRARGLEELLRLSDQATQAEQEERVQLESWLTEIEQRVIQREAESAAEIQRCSVRLKEVDTKREHAESQLKKLLRAQKNGSNNLQDEILIKLYQQNEALQQQLGAAQEENETLREQSGNTARSVNALDELQKMEQKLMQVQVDASREQAEMARQRAQLERLKDELQQKLSSSRELGEADVRIRAMRQHLQEIHEQEKLERDERKTRSLGGRISSLLNRVGR